MRRKLWSSLLFTLLVIALVALPVLAVVYTSNFTVTTTANLGVTPLSLSNNNTLLASNNFTLPSGLDVLINQGTTSIPRLLADNKTLFVAPFLSVGTNSFEYITGQTPTSSFPIITGLGGYITTPYNAALKPGGNFTFESGGWIDTTAGAGKNLIYNPGGFISAPSPIQSSNVTSSILATSVNQTQNVFNGGDAIDAADYTRVGQRYDAFSGHITNFGVALAKGGAPTGTANITIRRVSDDALFGLIGSIDVSTLDVVNAWYWYPCDVLIADNQSIRIAVEYSGGDAGNYISAHYQSTNQVASANYTRYSGGAWSDQAGDLRYQLIWEPITASVTITGVSSGDKTITTTSDTMFIYQAVNGVPNANIPVLNPNMYAPLWTTNESGMTFNTAGTSQYPVSLSTDAPTWGATGYTFAIAGNQFINSDNVVADGKLGNAFTIAAWVKMSAWTQDMGFVGSSDKNLGTSYGGLEFLTASKRLIYRANQVTGNAVFSTGTYDTDTNWHYLVVTVDADGHINNFLIDNVAQGNNSTATADLSLHTHMYFGRLPYQASSINQLGGIIGEVWLYTRELTLPECTQNYNQTIWKYNGTTNPNYAVVVGLPVPSNTNNWTHMYNNSMLYADNISMSINGTQRLLYKPNAIILGTDLPDRQGTQNGIITWGSNLSTCNVSGLASFLPVSTYISPGSSLDTVPPDVLPSVNPTLSPTTSPMGTTAPTNPLTPLINVFATLWVLPASMIWFFGACIFTIGAFVFMAIKFQHLGWAMVAAALVMGLFGALGIAILPAAKIIPQGMLVLTVIVLIAGIVVEVRA